MTGLKQQLLGLVEHDLERIEIALVDNLTPHLDLVRQIAEHLIFSGGKRLRPLLIILSARICGHENDFVARFATIFEFLHTATLLHDDVIDGATIRRGKPVAHSIWGVPITILVGDFLLARALCIASETENPRIIRVVSEMTEEMSQGEILQLMRKGDFRITEEDYMSVIRRKTGILIEGACRTGAILADAAPVYENALTTYGSHLGLVFQIADDILDYTADTAVIGKTIGADLKEGKLTLPVIHALKAAGPDDRAVMETIITAPDFSPAEFDTLIRLVEKYDGIAYARTIAREHVAAAKRELDTFPPSPVREILYMMADYALDRRA